MYCIFHLGQSAFFLIRIVLNSTEAAEQKEWKYIEKQHPYEQRNYLEELLILFTRVYKKNQWDSSHSKPRVKIKIKALHTNPNSKYTTETRFKITRPMAEETVQKPSLTNQSPVIPKHKHPPQGSVPEILDLITPLVIKLFRSLYLYSVSWETSLSPRSGSGSSATSPSLGTLHGSSYQGAESMGNSTLPPGWGGRVGLGAKFGKVEFLNTRMNDDGEKSPGKEPAKVSMVHDLSCFSKRPTDPSILLQQSKGYSWRKCVMNH